MSASATQGGHKYRDTRRDLRKTAKATEMAFGMWIRVCPRKHLYRSMCTLAKTIEPSMCGGDAALCQITLTGRVILTFEFHLHRVAKMSILCLAITLTYTRTDFDIFL